MGPILSGTSRRHSNNRGAFLCAERQAVSEKQKRQERVQSQLLRRQELLLCGRTKAKVAKKKASEMTQSTSEQKCLYLRQLSLLLRCAELLLDAESDYERHLVFKNPSILLK